MRMARYPEQIFFNDLNEVELNTNLIPNKFACKIGIQGPAGLQFKINEGSNIEMGIYGLYELDLSENQGQIRNVQVVSIPEEPSLAYILIDLVIESPNLDNIEEVF